MLPIHQTLAHFSSKTSPIPHPPLTSIDRVVPQELHPLNLHPESIASLADHFARHPQSQRELEIAAEGSLESAWDEDEPGSALGLDEIKLNVGRLFEGLGRSAKDAALREKIDRDKK